MSRPPSHRAARPIVAIAAAALAVAPLVAAPSAGAQTRRAASRPSATPKEAPMQAELEMMQAEAAFRGTVDTFVTAAVAGDAARVADMISPNMRERAGEAAVAAVMSGQVVPFFAGTKQLGALTVTTTTDQFGSQGFTYYTYAIGADGQPKPFVLYVVREGDRIVVANVLVDRYVEGRHR